MSYRTSATIEPEEKLPFEIDYPHTGAYDLGQPRYILRSADGQISFCREATPDEEAMWLWFKEGPLKSDVSYVAGFKEGMLMVLRALQERNRHGR